MGNTTSKPSSSTMGNTTSKPSASVCCTPESTSTNSEALTPPPPYMPRQDISPKAASAQASNTQKTRHHHDAYDVNLVRAMAAKKAIEKVMTTPLAQGQWLCIFLLAPQGKLVIKIVETDNEIHAVIGSSPKRWRGGIFYDRKGQPCDEVLGRVDIAKSFLDQWAYHGIETYKDTCIMVDGRHIKSFGRKRKVHRGICGTWSNFLCRMSN